MSYRKYLMTDDVPPSELYKTVKIDTDTDTISRAKAIEALDKRFDSIPMEQTSEILMLRKDLRDLPPAQPEIIRCKDCKHRDPEDKKCDCGHDIEWQLPRQDDWFCADGER